MRILVVLPQRQSQPIAINSVDLYAQALLERSCHQDYFILTHKSGCDFFGHERVVPIPRAIENHAFPTGLFAAHAIRRVRPNLVIVHQRFQIAVALRRYWPRLPVVYHGHSFHKGYPEKEKLRRSRRLSELLGLSGMAHVSEASEADFTAKWPEVQIPQAVIPNGLDFGLWHPASERAREIVCVGRAIPEKGLEEAATAASAVLAAAPDWTARFVISEAQRQPAYTERVLRALRSAETEGRVFVEHDLPWLDLKSRIERAAIALVPSLWREPFGRTALEAHAAGAAVISSGTGGLREISGEHALYADPREPGALLAALRRLVTDEVLRHRLARDGRLYAGQKFQIAALARSADEFYSTCVARAASVVP
jgi:glycosyltransferase involved in cell wall biosynthesis